MSFGETITRWAIIIGFTLLAIVTGMAGMLLLQTGQPGNPTLLLAIAIISAAIALWLHRRLHLLKQQGGR